MPHGPAEIMSPAMALPLAMPTLGCAVSTTFPGSGQGPAWVDATTEAAEMGAPLCAASPSIDSHLA